MKTLDNNSIKSNKINNKIMIKRTISNVFIPWEFEILTLGDKRPLLYVLPTPELPKFEIKSDLSFYRNNDINFKKGLNCLTNFQNLAKSNSLITALTNSVVYSLKKDISYTIALPFKGFNFKETDIEDIIEVCAATFLICNEVNQNPDILINPLNIIQTVNDSMLYVKTLSFEEEKRLLEELSFYFSLDFRPDDYLMVQTLFALNPWLIDYLNKISLPTKKGSTMGIVFYNQDNQVELNLGNAMFLVSCNNLHTAPQLASILQSLLILYSE